MMHVNRFFYKRQQINPVFVFIIVVLGVLQSHKFETCETTTDISWGYRRDVTLGNFKSIEEILSTLVTSVSCGGGFSK